MSNSIALTISASDQEVVRALQRTADGVDKVVNRIERLEKVSGRASTKMAGGLANATMNATKFVAAFAGVGSTMAALNMISQQLRAEYDNLVSRQQTAADKQIEYADSLAQTIRNAGGLFGGQETDRLVRQLAKDTRQDPTKVAIATGSVLSARGGTTKAEALDAMTSLKSVLQYFPEGNAVESALLSGSVVDLQKAFKIDANQATGLLQSTAGLARVTDLKSMADNVAPGIIGVQGFGGTVQESAALMAALSQGIQDPTGRETRNSAVNLAKRLQERFPDMGSTRERIEAIQNDPELYRRVIEGGRIGGKKFGALEIEAKSTTAERDILRGGTATADAFRAGIGKIGDKTTWESDRKTMIDEITSVRVSLLSSLKRNLAAGTSQIALNDETALGSIAREGYMNALKTAGVSDAGQKAALAEFEFASIGGTKNQLVALESGLRKRASGLSETRNVMLPGQGGSAAGGMVTHVPTSQDLSLARELQAMADSVSELSSAMRASTEATKRNSETTKENTDATRTSPAGKRPPATPASKRLSREAK